MIKALKGLMAICLMIIFSVVAFSPGLSIAAEKAVFTVAIANYTSPSIKIDSATGASLRQRYDLSAGGKPLTMIDNASAAASMDGYMNWRMHGTTRNI